MSLPLPPPDAEKDITSEGGFGHRADDIPWAEHAARVAGENNESIKEGFCAKAASISVRRASSAFVEDPDRDDREDREASTWTSSVMGDWDWARRPVCET